HGSRLNLKVVIEPDLSMFLPVAQSFTAQNALIERPEPIAIMRRLCQGRAAEKAQQDIST
ncbi:MAG: hypothetical protein QGG53_17880, partial [Planctomycetota bacterium]|nr:hypothetical protein [Planctomycetota bacterium]